ncbi:MAG: YgiT-type zinc finger protein [Treponema sp.]|nr:YgiT-type zinc finger protein [Treponema sp.]
MKCLACKNDTLIDSKTSYFVNLQNCCLIIENVHCKKCSQCGEEVFLSFYGTN